MRRQRVTSCPPICGEDCASGQSGATSTHALAQVGDAAHEVPLGGTVPAYYALLASAHLAAHRLTPADLAPLAVTMRAHAVSTPGAHLAKPITVEYVLASRPIPSRCACSIVAPSPTAAPHWW